MAGTEKELHAKALEAGDQSSNGPAQEKKPAKDDHLRNRAEILHEFRESEGYIIDIAGEDAIDASGLKLAKDGHTVLIPQPSDDTNDPLNWSTFKKHLLLFIVSFTALLPDYGSATGAVTLIPQAEYAFAHKRTGMLEDFC